MENQNKLKQGDLVEVVCKHGPRQWTLCARKVGARTLQECLSFDGSADKVFDPIYDCLLGKIGLITKIVLNKLDQPLVYEITISENVYYCKSILADKYLRKVWVYEKK